MWNIFSLLLLLANFASFPLITSSLVTRSSIHPKQDQLLRLFFHDLTNEGVMKKTQHYKAIFLSKQQETTPFRVFQDYHMHNIPLNDLEKENTIQDDTIDFVFTYDFSVASQFIERTLKINGVVMVLLNGNLSGTFYKPDNYKIVYMRRFGTTIAMAIKKTEPIIASKLNSIRRKLCGYALEAKKAALQNLEDVLLEPPRSASGKSRVYLKRTRYLPDLMGDSLESYPRRVFIDVGLKDGGSETDWFKKNYPTRNKNFEMYKVETVTEGSLEPQIEMSDWLRRNVKEEEYVVMKAEAEVVEEVMRSKAMVLVDELFLECKPKQGNMKSRRAYWECLALYGKLRDEGVAVHQWWGY